MDSVELCSCGCLCCSASTEWKRNIKRKFELEKTEDAIHISIDFDQLSIARVDIEHECVLLRETISKQQQHIQELYIDLEEERNASTSAANEAMSMILRLQSEKSEIQMEARQYKRFTEEKMAHDQQEILMLEDLLYRSEHRIENMTLELRDYKHRLMSLGLEDSGLEHVGPNYDDSRSSRVSFENQVECFPCDYPPLKCNLNESRACNDIEHKRAVSLHADIDTFETVPQDLQDLERLENDDFKKAPKDFQDLECHIPCSSLLDKNAVEETRSATDSVFVSTKEFSKNMSGSADVVNEVAEEHSLKVENSFEFEDNMSDRIYTIDAIHVVSCDDTNGLKKAVEEDDDYVNDIETSTEIDMGERDIKKLYMRLQALEADRESMRRELIAMQTNKARVELLKEIAQHLCNDMSSQRKMHEDIIIPGFSIFSAVKRALSLSLLQRRPRRNRYIFGISSSTKGLQSVLHMPPNMRQWRCITRTQMVKIVSPN